MSKLIARLSGSAAWGMTGIGPKPTLAPPDDNGSGGGNNAGNEGQQGEEGQQNGGGNGDGEGQGNGEQKGENQSRASRMGGLMSQRSKTGGEGEGNGNDDGQQQQTEEDGRPKGLADKFWNAKDKTINVDALTKAYSDLEKAHGDLKRQKGGGEVPKDPAEYFKEGVTVPEDATNFKGLGADDPGVKAWAEVCQKRGIGKALATELMSDMLVTMNGHVAAPIDPEAEMKSLGKGGPAMIDGLFTWVDGMERAGDLSEDDIGVIESIMGTANGARFLAKMRNMTGEKPIPVTPGEGSRGMSAEQWNDEMKAAIKAKDYKKQQELEAIGERINGTDNAFSGRPGGYSIG